MKKLLKGISLITVVLLVSSFIMPVRAFADLEEGAGNIKIDPMEGGFQSIGEFINNLARLIFIFAIVLVFVYFLWGGIRWITSGGDKAQTENARNVLTAALLGFAIIALAYAIVRLVGSFFGIDIFKDFTIPTPRPATNNQQVPDQNSYKDCVALHPDICEMGASGNCQAPKVCTTVDYAKDSESETITYHFCCTPK